MLEELKLFKQQFDIATLALQPLLTDYDKEVVLPTTCALGYHKPAHTELEERGKVGEDSSFIYDEDVMRAVIAYYSLFFSSSDKVEGLSAPRGTLIGYPFLISGLSRDVNDVLLALNAAFAIACMTKGYTLEEVTKMFERYHGPCIFSYGERYQHTSKVMPMITAEGVRFSKNFEPRCRMIVPSSKYMVLRMRPSVKKFLKVILKTDIHQQDRPSLIKTFDTWFKGGWKVKSLDHSKFDQRHGLPRSGKLIEAIFKVIGEESLIPEALFEFTRPHYAFYRDQAYIAPGDAMLKSGISVTTLIGCVGNLASVIQAIKFATGDSPEQIMSYKGTRWDLRCWGDDTLFAIKDERWLTFDALFKGYEKCKLKVEEEPTIKYLGLNYGRGQFAGTFDMGYGVGRAIQQFEFPERQKQYPFSLIGYIARIQMLNESKRKEYHSIYTNQLWNEKLLGKQFKYEEREAVLQNAVKEAEKSALGTKELDDILFSLTHGIDAEDSNVFNDPDLSMFGSLLGVATVDVSDPVKLMENTHLFQSNDPLIKSVTNVLNGDLSAYNNFTIEFGRQFGFHYQKGVVYY